MAKSDELATKEMPFRCYVGYDSHEDITFEVRVIRSILLSALVVESIRVLCFLKANRAGIHRRRGAWK